MKEKLEEKIHCLPVGHNPPFPGAIEDRLSPTSTYGPSNIWMQLTKLLSPAPSSMPSPNAWIFSFSTLNSSNLSHVSQYSIFFTWLRTLTHSNLVPPFTYYVTLRKLHYLSVLHFFLYVKQEYYYLTSKRFLWGKIWVNVHWLFQQACGTW